MNNIDIFLFVDLELVLESWLGYPFMLPVLVVHAWTTDTR